MQIEVLGERYQLQDPIGRGGMATIYRGRDIRMDRSVAIKVLREVYSTDPKFVTRFQREAKAASALQHPNIVQVYDYGQSDGNYFIVMELIDGTDLRRYLRSRGILATERAIIIAHDIALGLGAAHRRGIVHRDVKPQNVLVGRDGSIKLTDFGIASVYKDINDERLTTTGMTLGTVQYYAPEQAQGEIVSPAADVYALGIVMYEMMTGRTPFDGDTPVAVAMAHIQDPPTPPSHLNPNIPPALEEIILRCLEKVPEMRYRDGNVLARALESLGDGSLATGTAPTLSANSTVISPSTSGTQHQIPHRPTATPNGIYAPSNSSPNNQMEPQLYGPGGPMGDDAPTYRVDQNYSPMAPGQAGAMADYDPNAAYNMPPLATGSGATHPFSGAISRSDVPRDTRFASIVTILILCAALLFLGLAVFLANDLGYLNFGSNPQAQVTPTAVPAQVAVPNLVGKTWSDANAIATQDNFHLQLSGSSSQDGIVSSQDPQPPAKADPGSTITVTMKPVAVKIPVVKGESLSQAQQDLAKLGLKNVKLKSDPNDPYDPAQQINTVTGTDPAAGTTVPDPNTPVIVYVTNFGTVPVQQPTPTPTPIPSPTTQPTPTPTTQPTPTPTPKPKHTPTPTPTTSPSPTPTMAPVVTPTTGGTGAGTGTATSTAVTG
jgi:serine/threonine protein kinase/beta-lactam-binding protein with PASTA domain